MTRARRAAVLALLVITPSCVDTRQESRWCAEGKLESCAVACDRGDDAACFTAGKSLLNAVDDRDGGPGDERRALAMLSRACDRAVPKACFAVARAHDDGVSLAPLPWLERACLGGELWSCRDVAATRLGADDAGARDAYTRLCRLDAGVERDAQGTLRPGESPRHRDEPACVAAWTARHAAAKLASPSCDAGDARACETLGNALVDGIGDGQPWGSTCVEVFAKGMSPIGGALACERAGRAYARACLLRGLTEPPSPMMSSCPRWLMVFGRSRAGATRLASPPPGLIVVVAPSPGTPDAIVEAVRERVAPAALRCPAANHPTATAPQGRVRIEFMVDRTGRSAWGMARPRPEAIVDYGCLQAVLADADLGVPGDGRTVYDLDLEFRQPG